MNSNPYPFDSSSMPMSAAQAPAEARLNFIRLTYVLFMAGVVNCIFGGIVSLNTPIGPLIASFGFWPFLALFGLCFVAQMVADDPKFGYPALFGFTFLQGLIVAPMLARFAPSVLGQAGFLAFLIFGTLTAYTFITRKDFSFLGGFVFVGMITLILAGLANAFFFQSSGFSFWLAWGVLLISSGWVLYDTSEIMHRYPLNGYCGAALGLFISFWNIFISLVRILQGNDD